MVAIIYARFISIYVDICYLQNNCTSQHYVFINGNFKPTKIVFKNVKLVLFKSINGIDTSRLFDNNVGLKEIKDMHNFPTVHLSNISHNEQFYT